MRLFLFGLGFFLCAIVNCYFSELMKLEEWMFEFYTLKYKDYFIIDENNFLTIDKGKLEVDLEECGYFIKYDDSEYFEFNIKFSRYFNWEKVYNFYLKGNYEAK